MATTQSLNTAERVAIECLGINIVIKHAEAYPSIAKVLTIKRGKSAKATGRNILPIYRRHCYPLIRTEIPLVLNQLVQTLIVQCAHQVSIHWVAIGILNGQCPLFFLSWCQTIAEGGPLQRQFLIGHRALYLGGMGITLAILYPSKGKQQAVFVLILIGKLAVYQLVTLIHTTLLYQLKAREDTIEDMHILIRATHLDGNRRAIVRELGGRLVEPIICISSRFLIIEREYHEGSIDGLILIRSLYTMLTRSQLSQCYLLICSGHLPLASINAITYFGIDILTCGIAQMECGLGVIFNQHFFVEIDAECGWTIAQRQRELSLVRFASHISYIGLQHKVVEHSVLGFGHLQWHFYHKVTIGIGGSFARTNLGTVIAVAQSTLVVIAIVRPPPKGGTAQYLIRYLGILNRHTRIAECCTFDIKHIASLIGILIFCKIHMECGTLVLLNTNEPRGILNLDGKHTRKSLGRQGKIYSTHTIGIALGLLLGHHLMVGIAQHKF